MSDLTESQFLEELAGAWSSGVKTWNQWREGRREYLFDLPYTDLANAELPGIDLSEVGLINCNLDSANLTGGDLCFTRLTGSGLRNTNLTGALLIGAELANTDLRGANLREANLEGANLEGADLRGIDAISANFKEANLLGANLEGARLLKANFSRISRHASMMRMNDLRRAGQEVEDLQTKTVFKRADLSGANLSGAYLCGASLEEADCNAAELAYSDLRFSNLHKTKFFNANLGFASRDGQSAGPGTNLFGATATSARFEGANLTDATITNCDFRNAGFGFTILSHLDLGEARGLATTEHDGPSILDTITLERTAKGLRSSPKQGEVEIFLRGTGISEVYLDAFRHSVGRPIEFYSCFISYSHRDKSFARRLYNDLQAHGIRCWLDEHDLLPGDDIYESIDRAIRLRDKVLLCCSKSSLTSWWVEDEISKALEKERHLLQERNDKILAIIPLNLDGFLFKGWKSGRATAIRARLAADFTGWEDNNAKFEEQLGRVVKALRTDEDEAVRQRPPEPRL